MAEPTTHPRKEVKKIMADEIAHIHASFNSAIVTITDRQDNVLSQATSGDPGPRDSRKSTPFATQVTVGHADQAALEYGLKDLDVNVKDPDPDRKSVVRTLNACGYKIVSIADVTPILYNGYRPPKKRRVQWETVRGGSLR